MIAPTDMTLGMLATSLALSFFLVGGLAAFAGRSWQKWTAISILVSPIVALPVLVASLIVHTKPKAA